MCDDIQQLMDFRKKLHCSFPLRSDATMDLIDALAANSSARSPVELSLSSLFPRQYSSLHDALDNFFVPSSPQKTQEERIAHQKVRMHIIAEYCPKPVHHNYYLFGIDTTGQPRPFARTLADRAIQHHPNPAPGNKPIVVGHNYSILAQLPEKQDRNSPPYIIPLLIRRVPTDMKATEVGAAQVADLLQDKTLPFGNTLCVLVGDCSYSACEFLAQGTEHKNLIILSRVRGNRTFHRIPQPNDSSKGKGHPLWYGKDFNLKDSSTWGEVDATQTFPITLKNGRQCHVQIQAWHNLLMNGKRNIPMHEYPFTLIRITVIDSQGKMVFKNPLWLIALGEHRQEICLANAYDSYRQRYDMEHFFRFGKTKLLMASYQTPDVEHEQNWWEVVGLAYVLLYMSAPLAKTLLRPWERYLPQCKKPEQRDLLSPSIVQRDLLRIIRQIGTPSSLPKPRGKSSGRPKGYSPGKRERIPVIIKGTKTTKIQARAP